MREKNGEISPFLSQSERRRLVELGHSIMAYRNRKELQQLEKKHRHLKALYPHDSEIRAEGRP